GEYHYHGHTALLDNVQAAVLDVKLRHLPQWIEHRRAIAALYTKLLRGVSNVRLPVFSSGDHFDSYQNYVIRTDRRDDLREYLHSEGVETLVHWPKPMWDHKGLQLGRPELPQTEAICREVISLPLSAETTAEQAEITSSCIRTFFQVGNHKSQQGVVNAYAS